MAGGVGSRFWPMSKTERPKQFLDVLGIGRTLLQQTYDRFVKLCPVENIFIVTNELYKDLVAEQLPALGPDNVLLEPARKNTAPCIAYASHKIACKNAAALTVVAPSDHLILNEPAFLEAIESSYQKAASGDFLITLGITPTRPDTGYGYIQYADSEYHEADPLMKRVKTFTEKPDLEMAKSLLESGDFLWNAGIFVWSVKSIIRALDTYATSLNQLFVEERDSFYTPAEKLAIDKIYLACKNISVDYAVMEKADNVFLRIADIGWSDLGTWGSLYDHIKKDASGNAAIGKNVMLYDSKNCIVNVPKDKLVVLQGLEDFIVVEADGILLICKKEDEQNIKLFVNDVKVLKGEKYT